MINTEYLIINANMFIKTYSTEGFFIKKVGTEEEYEEAIDLLPNTNEYVETTKKIESFVED